ncbi:MAG: branched-chain amino acid ABC transporter substrate-binding protein [Chloroflexales bacterium]|nr:branched-chain amino acid ABC transporter substrate-binding protein [Chloroflexales bacterium]
MNDLFNFVYRQLRAALPVRFAVVFSLVLMLVACSGATGQSAPQPAGDTPTAASPQEAANMPEPSTHRIAIMAVLTGEGATYGNEQLNFARLAVEDFNAQHGTSIELVEGDTELDPAKGVTLAQRLLEDESIYAVIGPGASHIAVAVAPVFESANMAMISPSATRPDLTENGFDHVFRVVPRDDVQGPTAANFIVDQLGAKKVWIIDDQGAYSTGLADEAEKALAAQGVELTREAISQDDTDFAPLVTRMKAAAPDVVFIPWQLASQGALLAKQMAEQEFAATLFGGDGVFIAEDFIEAAAGAAEGAYVSFFAPDIAQIETAQAVITAYQERYGPVGPFGAPAYTATMVALEAIQKSSASGDLSREGVRAEIAQTALPDSLMGVPIQFDTKGDIKDATFFLYQVQDGKFTLVK